MRIAWELVLVAGVAGAAGCGDDDGMPPPGPITWACPTGWVEVEGGGCGPAVIVSPRDPASTLGAFGVEADGETITGGWTEPAVMRGASGDVDAMGVPAAGWVPPMAGIDRCAEGWTRSEDETCRPELATTCGDGAVAVPGGGCTAGTMEECPAGTWPDVSAEGIPAGAVVRYVDAGADPMGALGTEASPDATLAAAFARDAGGSGPVWYLIAAGTYEERIALAAGETHVIGVCAARVTFTATEAAPVAEARGTGTVLDLRGVTLTGGENGLLAADGAHATLRSVRVERAGVRGVVSSGAGSEVQLRDVLVRETVPAAADGFGGRGLQAEHGASLDAERVAVVGCKNAGAITLDAGSRIAIRDAVIRGTAEGDDGGGAAALWVDDAGSIEAERVLIEDTDDSGVYSSGAGAQLRATDVTILDTHQVAAGTYGRAASAVYGGTLELSRVGIAGAQEFGLVVFSEGSRLTASDSIVRAVRASASKASGLGGFATEAGALIAERVKFADTVDFGVVASDSTSTVTLRDVWISDVDAVVPGGGSGVQATRGGAATLERVALERIDGAGVTVLDGGRVDGGFVRAGEVRAAGIVADGAGSQVALIGVRIADVTPMGSGYGGHALLVQLGGRIAVERAALSRLRDAGVQAQGEGSLIVLADARIAGVDPGSDGLQGFGLYAADRGRLEASRVIVDDATAAGAIAATEGALILADVAVRDPVRDERFGSADGIEVQGGGTAEVSRSIVEGVSGSGATAIGSGSRLVLDRVVVRDVAPDVGGLLGRGVAAHGGARLEASTLLIERVSEAGVLAASPGTVLVLSDVIVRDVERSARGFGIGAGAFDGARIEAQRIATVGVSGAALLAAPGPDPAADGSFLAVTDAFVRGVGRSAIRATDSGAPEGREVAYAVHAGRAASVDVARMRAEDGGHGVVATGGSLHVTSGVITRQVEAAGALGEDGMIVLDDVALVANAVDEIRADDTLPEAAALPAPTPVCVSASACPPGM